MAKPRVLMLSQRRINTLFYRHNGYEFEDVICASDEVELVSPEYPDIDRPLEDRVFDKLGRTTGFEVSRRPSLPPPYIPPGEYDLLFVAGTDPYELERTGMQPWVDAAMKRCKKSVCYFEEMWENWLRHENMVQALAQFDHIMLGCALSCEATAKATGRGVTYTTPGIDMARFAPVPNMPHRKIDVRAMGRRSPDTHQALYEWSEREGANYVYDSHGGKTEGDLANHRNLQAGMIRRARYFMVNPAKVNAQSHTQGQQELALRFYEGAGAGAVLLGLAPRCQAYDDNFDWDDAVIHMDYGSTEVPAIIAELDQQPERLAKIRRDNVYHHLMRHDWAYRWKLTLDAVEMPLLPQAEDRIGRMQGLAQELPPDGLVPNAAELEAYWAGQGKFAPPSTR